MSFRFSSHPELAGRHAFLSASKHHWVNYDDERFDRTYLQALAAARGTELHDLASKLIKHRIKQSRTRKTFNMYVNDAIGFRMRTEQSLCYSANSFGTADAISYRIEAEGERPTLRIHDLKTGSTKTNVRQLEVYAALFCLEYGVKPGDINIELRIYQNDEVQVYEATVDDIAHIMDRIVTLDRRIDQLREEAFGD